MNKTAKEIIKTQLHTLLDDKGEEHTCILKADALEAMEAYAAQFASTSQKEEPKMEVISEKDLREGRPMYMNREDAIEGLRILERANDSILYENKEGFLKIDWEQVVYHLIVAGHLTNHLPEGFSHTSSDTD